MKNLFLKSRRMPECDGVTRRDVLTVGTVGFLGLTLPDYLAMRAVSAATAPKAEACIMIWLAGGPSHLDTFDPKPDAPSEYRGEFNAIGTNVDGIQISEHLPNTAKQMDKIALIRSLTSSIGAHEQATVYMQTGYKPLPVLTYPSYGSVVGKERGPRENLPPYIAIPDVGRGGGSGFLGNAHNAFPVGDPTSPRFKVPNVDLPAGVDSERVASRRSFIDKLNGRFGATREDDQLKAVGSFYERAYDLVNSAKAKKALQLADEPASVLDTYGRNAYGQSALLARRMVEAGARFVTINRGGWDTHQNNWERLKNTNLPPLDQAYSALLADLKDRGLLEKTLVVLMGEFGRTPKINTTRGGRDHYPRCRFACFAGGGVKGGQLVGKSDATGSTPAERPVSVEDISTSIYSALGIDPNTTYTTATGRPIRVYPPEGTPIKELFG